MEKVVFLDIDGVLNSYRYDQQRFDDEENIDITRLPLLKQLLDATGAKLVLTSSWRRHWEPAGVRMDAVGQKLEATFGSCGIRLQGKTPELGDRPAEILEYLRQHPQVERFVILDDIKFGWGSLDDHVVKTDRRIGRGLEQRHIQAAIAILNGEE